MDTAFEIIAKYARQLGLAIPPVTADGKEPQPFIWLGKEANSSRGQAFPCAYPPSVAYHSSANHHCVRRCSGSATRRTCAGRRCAGAHALSGSSTHLR